MNILEIQTVFHQHGIGMERPPGWSSSCPAANPLASPTWRSSGSWTLPPSRPRIFTRGARPSTTLSQRSTSSTSTSSRLSPNSSQFFFVCLFNPTRKPTRSAGGHANPTRKPTRSAGGQANPTRKPTRSARQSDQPDPKTDPTKKGRPAHPYPGGRRPLVCISEKFTSTFHSAQPTAGPSQ